MSDVVANLALTAGFVVAVGVAFVGARKLFAVLRRRANLEHPNAPGTDREKRLARRVADVVGCTPAQALPAVQREVRIAPGQPDDTLAKRAAYHYRADLPVPACPVYPDRAPG
jgi:hypothetical protein